MGKNDTTENKGTENTENKAAKKERKPREVPQILVLQDNGHFSECENLAHFKDLFGGQLSGQTDENGWIAIKGLEGVKKIKAIRYQSMQVVAVKKVTEIVFS